MQIVGSVQIKNEDIYIEQIILNILDFCDKVIITDHQSTDRTFEICKRLADIYPKIDLISIKTPHEAAIALETYYGTNTWIFGVDGDEVYDPLGLKTMRQKLMSGDFTRDWCIFGNVLNVTTLDKNKKKAKGYLAPPSRPMTKLYNFSMIDGWDNCPERLLGDEIRFKEGFNSKLRRYLHLEQSWDGAYFRCLHMPFMKRSSQQRIRLARTRLNPDEMNRIGFERNVPMRIFRTLQIYMMQFFSADWKNQKYRRGPLVEKDVLDFFS